jgi:hypothetical protein
MLCGFCCNDWRRNILTAMEILFGFAWIFSLAFFGCSNVLLGWNQAWMSTQSYVSGRFSNMLNNIISFNIVIPVFFCLHLAVLVAQTRKWGNCVYSSAPDRGSEPIAAGEHTPQLTDQV